MWISFCWGFATDADESCFCFGIGRVHFEASFVFTERISRVARGFEHFSQANVGMAVKWIDANRATECLFGARGIFRAKVDVAQTVVSFAGRLHRRGLLVLSSGIHRAAALKKKFAVTVECSRR